jgi:hypothetical protein
VDEIGPFEPSNWGMENGANAGLYDIYKERACDSIFVGVWESMIERWRGIPLSIVWAINIMLI